jgi:endonuclease-3
MSAKSRRRETAVELKKRGGMIVRRLRKELPGATTELLHANPFQLLIATILSAQCTDERVNKVTPILFQHYPQPRDLASAEMGEIEEIIRSTGFYRAKAKNIVACSKAIVERHGGEVPASLDVLVQLPGVGRKTANVVLGQSFGIASGVVVDTHVQRLAQRLALSAAEGAEKIEVDLMEIFPQSQWIELGSLLILHGRRTCNARKPACDRCALSDICPSALR